MRGNTADRWSATMASATVKTMDAYLTRNNYSIIYSNHTNVMYHPQLIHLYHTYGYPILIILGTLGNVLAYMVFARTQIRKISSMQYLAGVAITDTGFLWTFIFNPLYIYHRVPIIVQAGLCQLITLLNYVFTFLSIWYLAAMVVDKFIGVYWPLKKPSMCSPFRAKLVMALLGVFAVACYSYIGYFLGPDTLYSTLQCTPWRELRVHFENLSKIDTFVVALLPYATLSILTSLIVIRGCEYYRISAAVDHWPRQSGNESTEQQATMRVTGITFPIIITTVLCNLPVMAMRCTISYSSLRTPELRKWNSIFHEFYLLNFALKSIVYLVFSSNFRHRTSGLVKTWYDRLRSICDREAVISDSTPQRFNLEQLPKVGYVEEVLIKSDV